MTLQTRTTEPCPQCSEQMSLALDHQLCAAEESDLHEHLRTCDDCQRQWEALQQIELLFSNTPLIGPPAGFVARVNAHLAERESRQQIIFGVMSLAVGACSLGFVSLAAVGAAVPSLYSLYLLITTPAAWHSLTVVTDLLSVAESVFSALRLAILSGFRSPGIMICAIYSLVVLVLTTLWLRVLTGYLLRPVRVPRQV